ncbi:hypothetical protein HAV15_007581 [Penicillium sp. str. |nr:hypothetical protein HAV15_007581 [Penicillium sp. str. \
MTTLNFWPWRAWASGQSADWSANHLDHPSIRTNHPLESTASTSLTVAGFTASGQSEDWSVNHLDHPPRSSIHPNQPSTRINNIHSLTVEGFGFRTIGRLVTTTQSTPFEHPLPSSASINPPKQPFPV